MKAFLLLLILFFSGTPLFAQTFNGDSILASERSIDRPVTLHARQFRITAGYGLSVISRRFDAGGNIIRLRDEGLPGVRHRFALDAKYGVNDFIQFNAAIGRSGMVLREPTQYIFPIAPEPMVMQEVLKEHSGFEDVFLGVDLRAPFRTRKIDLAATLGVHLPVAPFEPREPEHSYEFVEESGTGMNKFVYRYHYPLGKGIAIAQVGGLFKYRAAQWAFSARVDYQHGLKDGKSFEWRHQLTNDAKFEYRQDTFIYRMPDSFSFFAETEYQPLPWFDIFLNISGHTTMNGWTASQEDLKIATPNQLLVTISPGFEIIVTPRLWLREHVNFSVLGESHEAPIGVQTSVIYNFFPF